MGTSPTHAKSFELRYIVEGSLSPVNNVSSSVVVRTLGAGSVSSIKTTSDLFGCEAQAGAELR